ncbi:HSP20-like chaperone [Hypoxylon trugodes]|uniref:HSP20-like chaperone n=1 Tax=Hypoxylon trugodes TaxID=326681 RepID=UPI0021974D85|nr:HSP20-like chaperone [Hypoxylon trugodes]KAI1383363.1 HSP20-like chaperone [Hypoxylon trugodes]
MQSCTRALKTSRLIPRNILNTTRYTKPTNTSSTFSSLPQKINFHTTTAKMSMFGPRFYSPAEPNFTGLFRLIDDFDKYSNAAGTPQQGAGARQARHVQTFTPKFDLKETENHYELHGELPGIEKQNVHIEFTDPQTIVVRGRIERTYTSGTPPADLLEKSDEVSGAITEAPKEQQPQHDKAHQPTVEDDTEGASVATPTSTTVTETDKNKAAAEHQPQQPKQPQHRFWVSERSVGEFSRTFQFPTRVDTDNVNASLNNGILSVVVPKAKKHEGRRIFIN